MGRTSMTASAAGVDGAVHRRRRFSVLSILHLPILAMVMLLTGAANSVAVAAPTLSPAPGLLPPVEAYTPYSQPFIGSGGTGPYSYSLASGSLPVGLALSGATGNF